jgi:hypothetical protein
MFQTIDFKNFIKRTHKKLLNSREKIVTRTAKKGDYYQNKGSEIKNWESYIRFEDNREINCLSIITNLTN